MAFKHLRTSTKKNNYYVINFGNNHIAREYPDIEIINLEAAAADETDEVQTQPTGTASRKTADDDLPDLKCQDVAQATIKIQKAYRGFKTRLVL